MKNKVYVLVRRPCESMNWYAHGRKRCIVCLVYNCYLKVQTRPVNVAQSSLGRLKSLKHREDVYGHFQLSGYPSSDVGHLFPPHWIEKKWHYCILSWTSRFISDGLRASNATRRGSINFAIAERECNAKSTKRCRLQFLTWHWHPQSFSSLVRRALRPWQLWHFQVLRGKSAIALTIIRIVRKIIYIVLIIIYSPNNNM